MKVSLNAVADNFEQLASSGIAQVTPWVTYAILAFSAIELALWALEFANGKAQQHHFWRLLIKTGLFLWLARGWPGHVDVLMKGGGWIAQQMGSTSKELVSQPDIIVRKAFQIVDKILFPELGYWDKLMSTFSFASMFNFIFALLIIWRMGSIAFGVMYIIASVAIAKVVALALLPFIFFDKTRDYFPNVILGLVKAMVWVTVTYILLGIIWTEIDKMNVPANAKDPSAWTEYVYVVTILTWIFHEVRTGVVDIIFASVTNQRAPNVQG